MYSNMSVRGEEFASDIQIHFTYGYLLFREAEYPSAGSVLAGSNSKPDCPENILPLSWCSNVSLVSES